MKSVHNDMLDAALNYIKNNCDEMTLCSQPPTTYAEAHTTYKLADVAMASGDFTVGDGDASGRKATVAEKTGIAVDATGVGNHVALTDTGTSKLLYVTPAEVVRSSTAQAGGASTITLDAGASADDDEYNDMAVVITGGTGAGQTRMISDYVGSTKVATVSSAWDIQPDATSEFTVYGQHVTSGNTVDLAAWDIELADPSD